MAQAGGMVGVGGWAGKDTNSKILCGSRGGSTQKSDSEYQKVLQPWMVEGKGRAVGYEK